MQLARIPTMNFADSVNAPGRQLTRFAISITRKDGDSDSVHLRKSVAVIATLVVMPAALIWGVIYLLADEPVVGAIPLVFVVLTVVNLVLYRAGRNYAFFEFTQLLMQLLVPFLAAIALGGFVSSSGTPAWLLITPVYAAVFSTRRMAYFWFGALIVAAAIGAVIEPSLDHTNNVPVWARTAMFGMNIVGPSSVAFGLLLHFVNKSDTAYTLLDFERNRSETLLQNVLPAKIAARLKDGTENVADRFDEVSVLFADMVGSTELASKLSPEKMVGLLNEVFSHFDAITIRHGVEKISTSGDNYLVAAGVPEIREDHATALVKVAIEMRDYLEDRRGGSGVAASGLAMRFGINTGPAVAGVVGQRNFHYDIWGDAVNTASRMESHGEPGRIQISEATCELVKDEFECEPRGEIDVKGKGLMRTWFVTGAGRHVS